MLGTECRANLVIIADNNNYDTSNTESVLLLFIDYFVRGNAKIRFNSELRTKLSFFFLSLVLVLRKNILFY